MPIREGIYGLLAEFDTPSELVVGREDRLRLGLAAPGLLHPLPGGRGGGSDRFPSQLRAPDLPGRRPDGVGCHVPDGDLGFGFGLSAEHRRPPALFLAGLHYSGLRVDHPLGGSFRRFRHAGHVRPADALSPALQRAQFPYRGNRGQVLSLPGGERSQVRAWWNRAPFWKASRRFRWWRWSINPITAKSVLLRGCCCRLGCSLALLPAAARTCKTSPSSFPSAAPPSSPMAARFAPRWRTPWLAASWAKTAFSTPA